MYPSKHGFTLIRTSLPLKERRWFPCTLRHLPDASRTSPNEGPLREPCSTPKTSRIKPASCDPHSFVLRTSPHSASEWKKYSFFSLGQIMHDMVKFSGAFFFPYCQQPPAKGQKSGKKMVSEFGKFTFFTHNQCEMRVNMIMEPS